MEGRFKRGLEFRVVGGGGVESGAWAGATNVAVFETANAVVNVTAQADVAGIKFKENATISSSGKFLTLGHNAELFADTGKTGTMAAAFNPTYGFSKTGAGTVVLNNAGINLTGMIVDVKEGTLRLQNVDGLTTLPNQGYTEGLGKFILRDGSTLQFGMATAKDAGIQTAIDVVGESTIKLNNSANTFRNITNSSNTVNILHLVSGGSSNQLIISSMAPNVVLQFDRSGGASDMSGGASFVNGTFGGLQGGWVPPKNGNFRIDSDELSSFNNSLVLDVAEGKTYTFNNTIASATDGSSLTKKGKGTQVFGGKYGYYEDNEYIGAIRTGNTMSINVEEGTFEVQGGINGDRNGTFALKIAENGIFAWNTDKEMTDKVNLSGNGVLRMMKTASLQNDFSNFTGTTKLDAGVTATWTKQGTKVQGKIIGEGKNSSKVVLAGANQVLGGMADSKMTIVDHVSVQSSNDIVIKDVSFGSDVFVDIASSKVAILSGNIELAFADGSYSILGGSGMYSIISGATITLNIEKTLLNSISGSSLELVLFDPAKWTFDVGFDTRNGLQLGTSIDGFTVVLDESNFTGQTDWTKTGKVHLSVNSTSIPEPTTGTLCLAALGGLLFYRRRAS